MERTGLHQQEGQLLHRLAVGPLRAAGGTALEHHRQILKGFALGYWTDPATGHTDGIAFLQKPLLPVSQFLKGGLNRCRLSTIPEDCRIIPGIVPCYILAGFLSVLVLGSDIKRNPTAVELRHSQILLRCFLGTTLFFGVLADNLALRFACFIVEPRNPPHPLILVQGGKGTAVKENILLAFNIVLAISDLWFFISYRIAVKVYQKRDIA